MDINLPMSPPVNNSLQETLYDKLDAVAFEKTRVMNCQLDTRLSIQERIINKYRRDVQRIHENQSRRLRLEFKKIHQKKPDYVYDDTDLVMSRSRVPYEGGMRQRSQSETSVPSKGGHCRRYYAHHYHVKYDKNEKDKHEKQRPREKTDFFNLKLKLFFYNTMNNIYNTQKRMKEEMDSVREEHTILPEISTLHQKCEAEAETVDVLDDDVFGSPRYTDAETEQLNKSPDILQNSTNSFFSRTEVDISEEHPGEPENCRNKPDRKVRKRASRTLRMYGSDTVLNHVTKKRESLDEKEFARRREQWLQSRQSSEKLFAALT